MSDRINNIEDLTRENRHLRGLLDTAIEADEANGIRKLIDGREYHVVKHDLAWIAAVKEAVREPHTQDKLK